jgi:hypothetical protein
MNWLEGSFLSIPKGESMTLRYRVVAHRGDTQSANIQSLFNVWRQSE